MLRASAAAAASSCLRLGVCGRALRPPLPRPAAAAAAAAAGGVGRLLCVSADPPPSPPAAAAAAGSAAADAAYSVSVDRSALKSPCIVDAASTPDPHFHTPLEEQIFRSIKARGALPLSEFMKIALTHPEHGYYMRKDVFGSQGDFTTAPEISQLFGEMVGVWILSTWMQLGKPTPCTLVELGPGRGTLMFDALRSIRSQPELFSNLSLCMVEVSPHLRNMQMERLQNFDIPKTWHDSLHHIPQSKDCVFVIGQEFLDAMCVRQFEFSSRGWLEKLVDINVDSSGNIKDGDLFRLVLSSAPTPASTTLLRNERVIDKQNLPQIGDSIEVSAEAMAMSESVASLVASRRGAALFMDYGNDFASPGSLRGIREHKFVPFLSSPGKIDLSADVDFSSLRRTIERLPDANKLKVSATITQGDFLQMMGIVPRLEHLIGRVTCDLDENTLIEGYERLVDPKQMGSLYKALALVHADAHCLPGFPHPNSSGNTSESAS